MNADTLTDVKPVVGRRIPLRKCTIPMCDNIRSAKEYCKYHYSASRYRNETFQQMAEKQISKSIARDKCKYENCLRLSHSDGLRKYHNKLENETELEV